MVVNSLRERWKLAIFYRREVKLFTPCRQSRVQESSQCRILTELTGSECESISLKQQMSGKPKIWGKNTDSGTVDPESDVS